MASLITRNIVKIARNNTLISSVRCYSDVPYVEPHKGKVGKHKTLLFLSYELLKYEFRHVKVKASFFDTFGPVVTKIEWYLMIINVPEIL